VTQTRKNNWIIAAQFGQGEQRARKLDQLMRSPLLKRIPLQNFDKRKMAQEPKRKVPIDSN
jgi:hypothetical protein